MAVDAAGLTQAAPLDHAAVRTIVIGILLAMLLAALDQTIVATALPTIGRDARRPRAPALGRDRLSADARPRSRRSTASSATSTAAASTLLIGIGTFVLGSVACALAPTMLALILARALQGLGGGGLISLAQTIIADIVAPKERGRYQGYIAGVFVTSSVAGPVLGGFFAEHLHWSLIFWINLPLGLLAFLMTNRVLRRLPRHERPHRLDVLGAVLMVAGDRRAAAGAELGRHALSLGLAADPRPARRLGAGWLCCSWSACRPRPSRSCRSTVLLNPVVAAGTAAACFAMGTFIGLSIYVPIYLQIGAPPVGQRRRASRSIPLMGGTVVRRHHLRPRA